jgi:thiamine biosynthesis protein ThiI
MTERSIILRYHEIALKGDNRGWFEDRLALNAKKLLQRALGKDAAIDIKRHYGRIEVQTEWNEESREALTRLFGVSSFSPMRKVKTDKEMLGRAVVEEFDRYRTTYGMPTRFKVKTKRSDKALPESSTDLDRYFGAIIKDLYPSLIVDLKNPDMTVGVELRFEESFIWTEKIPALGGLPVGSNGSVLSLLSGGLDSPVAAIQVLRRGSPSAYLHFYGAPFVGEEVLAKIEDLVRIINRYQPNPQPLHLVPFGKIQEKIALVTNPKMRTLLYRRMMIRVANRLAKRIGAEAIVTGESLGQVASQTVENMATINAVAEIPILRPLVTYDKIEIVAQAKKWGSYEVSIRPGLDCCTLFGDRHPTLRSTPAILEEQEAKFPMLELVDEALDGMKIHKVY